MTLTEWKEVANIFQAIAVGIAVLVGGGWTLFRYFSLRSIQHAQASLEKTRIELERERRALQERGIIEIALEAEQMFLGNDYLIGVNVTLKNTGSGTEVLDWSKSLMTAQKVICKSDGSVGYSKDFFVGESPGNIVDSSLAPGELSCFTFIIRVADSGIYYLRFLSVCSRQATQLARRERALAGIKQPDAITWDRAMLLQVKDIVAKEADI